jgi:energy-coupling factor transporter ATP-binding protein EcfA2
MAEWEQGEHIAVMGPTGTGKTTLAFTLLDGMADAGYSVLVLANKPKDATLSKMAAGRWDKIRAWPPRYEHRHPNGHGAGGARIIVWPNYGRASTARANRPTFVKAMDEALHEGGWIVYIDETRYFIEQLGMRQVIDEYWNAARSSDVTMMSGAQGPSWINRTMITQETWLFAFRPSHEEEAKDIAKIAGVRTFSDELMQLNEARHEFIAEKTRSHARYVSRVTTSQGTSRARTRARASDRDTAVRSIPDRRS